MLDLICGFLEVSQALESITIMATPNRNEKFLVNTHLQHNLWYLDRVRSRTRSTIGMETGRTRGRIGDMSLMIRAIKVLPIPAAAAKVSFS